MDSHKNASKEARAKQERLGKALSGARDIAREV